MDSPHLVASLREPVVVRLKKGWLTTRSAALAPGRLPAHFLWHRSFGVAEMNRSTMGAGEASHADTRDESAT